jgi:hypothetical protein
MPCTCYTSSQYFFTNEGKEQSRCGRCRPGGEAVVSSINFDTSSSESTWKEHDSACYMRYNIPWNAICAAENSYKIVSVVISRKKSSSSGPNITIRDVASFRLSQFSQSMPDVFIRHSLILRKWDENNFSTASHSNRSPALSTIWSLTYIQGAMLHN